MNILQTSYLQTNLPPCRSQRTFAIQRSLQHLLAKGNISAWKPSGCMACKLYYEGALRNKCGTRKKCFSQFTDAEIYTSRLYCYLLPGRTLKKAYCTPNIFGSKYMECTMGKLIKSVIIVHFLNCFHKRVGFSLDFRVRFLIELQPTLHKRPFIDRMR